VSSSELMAHAASGSAAAGVPWAGGEQVDVDSLVQQLDTTGYIIVPNWISPAEVQRQREAMEAVPVLRQHSPSHAPNGLTVRAHNLLGKTRECDHLATDTHLLAVVQGHLRDSIQFSICTLMDILPGEESQRLHQDDAMYRMARPHMPLTVNTVIALDDFTSTNGATRIVPFSKDWGEDIDQDHGDGEAVPACCPAGSLIAWSGSSWHGGGANDSDSPRLALNFHYCLSWLKPQESQVLGVDPAEVLTLSPQLQELLGYTGSVSMRSPMDVVADREAGKPRPWVHPQAAVPGVSKSGAPLPPDSSGARIIASGPHKGAAQVGERGAGTSKL